MKSIRIGALAIAATVAIGANAFGAATVLAEETSDALMAKADSLSGRIEETTRVYQQAAAEVERINGEIASNEQRVAEIEAALPEQRARTASSIRTLYKFEQSQQNLLSILLSAEDFEDFITTMHYLTAIHEYNLAQISNLNSMNDELVQTRANLDAERSGAEQRQQDAYNALAEARAAREELQAQAIQKAIDEAASREQAIQAVTQIVQEAAAQEEVATFTTASGNEAVIEVPETPSVTTEPLVTNTTVQETGDWASRINAYLEGSPLEGYGQVFADAAAQYGVDPRLSPAIATVESGKGEFCFKENNAWGWGSSEWESWDEAIYDHVEGLAEGYDGTLTMEGAERYCPPSADEWYSSVASEMDGI